MGSATAETLYRIAARKASDGLGWDALNAQLAADTLLITQEMEKHPNALLDLGPLKSLELSSTALPEVARAYRRQLLRGLDSWGISGVVGAALPEVALTDTPLDPAAAGDFAAAWLGGRDLETFAAAEKTRAVRLAALAGRMFAAGEYEAAVRSGRAADRSAFAAHYGAEAAATGDVRLAALRTGLLLVEDSAGADTPADFAEAGRQARRTYEAANLTDNPIHWETISYLS